MGSADPNPAWTRAPWAGVPQPASLLAGAPLQAPAAAAPNGVSATLTDAARMPPPPPRPPRPSGAAPDSSDWQSYFSAAVDVPVGQDVFRVYMAGSSGPLVLALHGAGCTALSFAASAPALAAAASCRVAAIDLRGHGASRCADETDLSSEARACCSAVTCSPLSSRSASVLAAAGGRRACSGTRAARTLRRG